MTLAEPHWHVEAMSRQAEQQPPGRHLVAQLRRDPLHTMLTVVIDTVAAMAAVGVSMWWGIAIDGLAPTRWQLWLFVPLVLLILGAKAMYRRSLQRNFLDEIGPVSSAISFAALVLLTILVLVGDTNRPGYAVVRIWICAIVLIPLARLVRAAAQRYLRRHLEHAAPTLVVGDGAMARALVSRMNELPEYGLRAVAILDYDPERTTVTPAEDGIPDVLPLGSKDEFVDTATKLRIEDIVIADCSASEERLIPICRAAHQSGIRVWVVPKLHDAIGAQARIEHLGGVPLLVLPQINPRGWQFAVKHTMDRVLTGVGLLLISPLFLTLALLVKVTSPGPVFFKQPRVGRDGKPFDCLKFRSMRPPRETDAAFELASGSAPGGVEGVDRRTAIGKIMRATSLDELPQLLNVLRGEMSLVGPRPERPEYVELFELQIRRYGERHRVKAGVTGWAQVHGLRGQTSIADRAEWDNYYIENWSLWLDLKTLALTVPAVLKRAE
ncbi:sugar transferase [Mycolicibacterium bacteremicum]|nr:sugar transferase [Mycolicibacterium bacteremicum]